MPVLRTSKLIVSDPQTGRLIRMNTEPLGADWEEWGFYCGGAITIGGVALATYDDYLDAEYDEENKVLYYGTDSKGILKLDLVNDAAAIYNVAGGSLRNDACYGTILTADKARLIVLHGANGISIIDPVSGVKLADHAAAGAICENGVLNRAETEIVVWHSDGTNSLPSNVDLATGVVTAWSWGAMPYAGTAYMDDCDWNHDDGILYVEMHFTSTPSGGHRQAHVLVNPATMTPTSWVWLDNGDYSYEYANVACVDVDVGYYAHAFRFNSSQDKLSLYRLSDDVKLATYDTTTSPVFGYKSATNWRTRSVRCAKNRERGKLYVFVNQYDYYSSPSNALLTIYDINESTRLWSKKYDFYYMPTGEFVEIDKQYGVDPSPVYISRRVQGDTTSQYLFKFHEWENNFLVSNCLPGNGVTPFLFDKDFPWTHPWSIYRRADGVIYAYDRISAPNTNVVNRVVRYLGWKTGGRLKAGYSTVLDGEGNCTTGEHVGCIESADLVFYDGKRPGAMGALFPDFAYSTATDVEFMIADGVAWWFCKVIGNYLYVCFYVSPPTARFAIYKHDQTGVVIDSHIYDELGVGANPLDLWIDPDDGRHYLACADRIVRYDDFAGSNYASFGTSGSGINQFSNPMGIYGGADYLYVADTGNNRIVRIDKAAFDGTGWTAYGTKGFAGEGRLASPCKLVGMTIEEELPEVTGLFLPPDMLEGVALSHKFTTSIFRVYGEKEFRAAHVSIPCRLLSFQFSTMESELMAKLFRDAQKLRAREWSWIPIWPYAMRLAVNIEALDESLVVVDWSDREMESSGVVLVFDDVDSYEAVEYATIAANEVFLAANWAFNNAHLAEDTIVVPCMRARLPESLSLRRWEMFKAQTELAFEEAIIEVS
jgi:hypothetical protein